MAKRLKLLWCAAMSILAICLAAGSGASAVELRNLPANVKFTLGGEAGGGFLLKSLSGKEIKCNGLSGSGEFTTERLGAVTFKFTGCVGPLGVKCTGLSDTTEGNITVPGEFHTRHLLPSGEGVNVAMLAASAHFACLGILFKVSGCVATMDLLSKEAGVSIINLLLTSVFVTLLSEQPTSIDTDNSLGMEECLLKIKEGSGGEESTGLSDAGTIREFRTGSGPVTELVDLSGVL